MMNPTYNFSLAWSILYLFAVIQHLCIAQQQQQYGIRFCILTEESESLSLRLAEKMQTKMVFKEQSSGVL
jgi:hypothetical protein